MFRALTTRRAEMVPFLLLAPALITMLFVVALPLVFSLWTSLTPYQLTKPQTIHTFVGLKNYIRILTDSAFWIPFGCTVLFLTIALNLEFAFGLGMALLHKWCEGIHLVNPVW